MTNFVWDIYVACGIKYFALLILSFIAVLGYIIKVLLSSKDPTALWPVLIVSFIPLAIGLYATFNGYTVMLRMARDVQVSSEDLEFGYATARVSSYFGVTLSAPLVLFAIVGVAMKRKRRQVHVANEHELPKAR